VKPEIFRNYFNGDYEASPAFKEKYGDIIKVSTDYDDSRTDDDVMVIINNTSEQESYQDCDCEDCHDDDSEANVLPSNAGYGVIIGYMLGNLDNDGLSHNFDEIQDKFEKVKNQLPILKELTDDKEPRLLSWIDRC